MKQNKKIRGIYAICDVSFSPHESHLSLAKKLLAGGIKTLQLRMKNETNADKVATTTKDILQLKGEYEFTFILNDYVEIGIELGVDGLHVGQDDLPIQKIRELTGQDFLVGYSSHSYQEALAAEAAGASYVALGAIFPTPTKGPGHPVVGVDTLRLVVDRLKVPVVAIGGIVEENFQQVLDTGVDAIAMITALTRADNITTTAKMFSERMKAI